MHIIATYSFMLLLFMLSSGNKKCIKKFSIHFFNTTLFANDCHVKVIN